MSGARTYDAMAKDGVFFARAAAVIFGVSFLYRPFTTVPGLVIVLIGVPLTTSLAAEASQEIGGARSSGRARRHAGCAASGYPSRQGARG